MAAGVALQVGQLTEGLVASWVTALVGLVPCMSTDVLLKMRQLCELALANLATVGFDTQVNPSVLGQVR